MLFLDMSGSSNTYGAGSLRLVSAISTDRQGKSGLSTSTYVNVPRCRVCNAAPTGQHEGSEGSMSAIKEHVKERLRLLVDRLEARVRDANDAELGTATISGATITGRSRPACGRPRQRHADGVTVPEG
jgi:hypothetical protein